MKKPKISELPAAAFVVALLALTALGARTFFASALAVSDNLRAINTSLFEMTEDKFNNDLPTRTLFIDINSFISKLTGKRTDNEYVRLNNGNLAYTVEKQDVAPFSDAVVRLNNYVKETTQKPFLFVLFPFSINPNDKQLPAGCEDCANENADDFLAQIKAKGVQTYDFRPFCQSQPDYYSLFYRTDHHWKAETAFTAARELLDVLAARDPTFAVDKTITNERNYRYESRHDFLGSTGRRFGYGYCGYESFTAISPRFGLDLEAFDAQASLLRGDSENTVLFPRMLTYENHYLCDMYGYYMDGDHAYRRFVNRSTGLNVAPKKLLVIKDSYANAMLPYLIYGYAEVTVVDLRYLPVPLTQVVEQADPDLTIVAYNPGALSESNEKLFRFFE